MLSHSAFWVVAQINGAPWGDLVGCRSSDEIRAIARLHIYPRHYITWYSWNSQLSRSQPCKTKRHECILTSNQLLSFVIAEQILEDAVAYRMVLPPGEWIVMIVCYLPTRWCHKNVINNGCTSQGLVEWLPSLFPVHS